MMRYGMDHFKMNATNNESSMKTKTALLGFSLLTLLALPFLYSVTTSNAQAQSHNDLSSQYARINPTITDTNVVSMTTVTTVNDTNVKEPKDLKNVDGSISEHDKSIEYKVSAFTALRRVLSESQYVQSKSVSDDAATTAAAATVEEEVPGQLRTRRRRRFLQQDVDMDSLEMGVFLAIIVLLLFILLLCFCCMCCCMGGRPPHHGGPGGGGGSCLWDCVALVCLWEMCCDHREVPCCGDGIFDPPRVDDFKLFS